MGRFWRKADVVRTEEGSYPAGRVTQPPIITLTCGHGVRPTIGTGWWHRSSTHHDRCLL